MEVIHLGPFVLSVADREIKILPLNSLMGEMDAMSTNFLLGFEILCACYLWIIGKVPPLVRPAVRRRRGPT